MVAMNVECDITMTHGLTNAVKWLHEQSSEWSY